MGTRSWLCFYTREVSHNLRFLTMRGAQRFCVEFSRKPSKVEVLLYLHSHMARGNTSGRIVQVPSNRMVVRNDFLAFGETSSAPPPFNIIKQDYYVFFTSARCIAAFSGCRF